MMLTKVNGNQPTESDMLAVRSPTDLRPRSFSLQGKAKANSAQMDDAAKEFEAQFISQMVSTMYSTVERDEETGGGDAEDVYQGMLQNEYGKVIARTGGIGVADQVKQIMISQQEVE